MSTLGERLYKELGLEGMRVRDITIHVPYGEAATVTLECLLMK